MALAVPALSSLAGANHTIYLDFDGHVTEGTTWNSYFNNPSIRSPAYSSDGDATSFTSGELADIQQAWQRIAEDYLPFAVNVTTVDPGVEALRKSGGGDTQWGIRVVITADTEKSGAGGIAYVDSFNWSSDTPAFVYNTSGKYIAEAASHEAGHTLGLAHDGITGSAYYYGHGSGATSWAPLMGVGYYTEVTQWDRGEYSGATNGGAGANYGKGPSDLAVITSYNGFGYRADDHGNTTSQPTALATSGGAVSGSGIIGTAQDADVFAFMTGAGNVTLNVSPAALGANLDVQADLLDAAGNLVASSNPVAGLAASLALDLPAGMYYLRIDGVGVGNPGANPPTGYTDYGSLGQYTISGQIIDAGGLATIAVSDVAVSESAAEAVFTITLSGTITDNVTVEYLTSDDTARAGSDYTTTQATHTFTPGGANQFQVAVPIVGDTAYETVERFFLRLQNASNGAMISDGQGIGTINDDDIALSISNWSTREGSPNRGRGSSGVQLTPFTFTISLSGPAANAVSVRYDTQNGTAIAGTDYNTAGGTVTFAPGETAKTITIDVIADSNAELDEGFTVVLSAPVGADLADASGNGTILDDDTKSGGKPPKITAPKPAKAPKPATLKPVRDVFAWQEGAEQLHDHDHDASGLNLDLDSPASASLLLSDRSDEFSPPASAAPATARLGRAEASLFAARPARWQLPVGPESAVIALLGSDASDDASGEASPADDADWLDVLARARFE